MTTRATFFRLLEADDKSTALLDAIHHPEPAAGRQRFEVNPDNFRSVPGSPFAYWVSDQLRRLFTELSPFATGGRTAGVGVQTSDDFRFVRLWWDVAADRVQESWVPLAKGGRFSIAYQDVVAVLRWTEQGRELKTSVEARYGTSSKHVQNERLYMRPGLSWPLRGSRFSAHAIPAGCIFSVAGKMAFFPDNNPLPWIALFNSSAFDGLIAFFAGKVGGVQYEAGLLQRVPIPEFTPLDITELSRLGRRAWELKRSLDTRNEISHAFTMPAVLQVKGETLNRRSEAWAKRVRNFAEELAAIHDEIDVRCFDLYGIDKVDRRVIREGFGQVEEESKGEEDSDSDDEVAADRDAGAAILVAEFLSWTIGVAFGRFDLRLATGERLVPKEPQPFDALPICSPGMLVGEDGLPPSLPECEEADLWNSFLVDDPGHPWDIAARVQQVLKVIWKNDWEAVEDEACELLRLKSMRDYFRKPAMFFAQHVKRYSKSRRKAPIYWHLATPSASYSVWLYYHRITKDTFFKVLNEYVKPKLDHERQKLDRLRGEAGAEPTRSQRKEIEDQEKFVAELASMVEEVERIAPLWNPNLNDGVIINFAPLWRLVPQNKSWQKECKKVWDKLVAGDYDWAHLAMHLWPERVVPKCVADASLAIAHGLEETFWTQDEKDRFQPLEEPTGGWQPVIDELVEERTSPAVKASLESLLSAPAQAGKTSRRKRSKK